MRNLLFCASLGTRGLNGKQKAVGAAGRNHGYGCGNAPFTLPIRRGRSQRKVGVVKISWCPRRFVQNSS